MLLILDRISGNQDDFAISIGEELYDVLSRRGLKRIDAFGRFDPAMHKAVRMVEGNFIDAPTISQVVRYGYTFNGRVIRPAEVVVICPKNTQQGLDCDNINDIVRRENHDKLL